MDQELWNYFVGLRQELLTAVTGIKDAGFSLYWDNTTPNYATRNGLRSLLNRRVQESLKFGVYVVTRHSDCGKRGHYSKADEYGYITSNTYGMDIPYRDERFEWAGDQLFQGSRNEACPCSKKGDPIKHHVIDDMIFDRQHDVAQCKVIASVLCDIQSAIDAAGDKHPRSGIREYLLRAIIQLNDAILPTTVDAHIKAAAAAKP